MKKLVKAECVVRGQEVFYVASHLDKTMENAERGIVSTVDDRGVWVRYTTGDTGAKTDMKDLYVKG